jgi:hypothetical protein
VRALLDRADLRPRWQARSAKRALSETIALGIDY